MAHLLTDEAFALSIAHFRRLGRPDVWGYWVAAIVSTFIPWNLATLAGVLVGGSIPDPSSSASTSSSRPRWSGSRSGLITGRRELVAAIVGAARRRRRRARRRARRSGSSPAAWSARRSACSCPRPLARETAPLGSQPSAERYAMPGTHVRRRPDEPPERRR